MRHEILLGSTRVKFEGRNFVLTDADQNTTSVFIDQVDATELIMFMYQCSEKVQTDLADHVGVTRAIPNLPGPASEGTALLGSESQFLRGFQDISSNGFR